MDNKLITKTYYEKTKDASDEALSYWNGEDWGVVTRVKPTSGILISESDFIELLNGAWEASASHLLTKRTISREFSFNKFLESKGLPSTNYKPETE